MSETRSNPVDGRTVVYAPARRERPHDIALPRGARGFGDPQTCPFCPHNAARHGEPLYETAAPDGGWQTRVVPNRFPIVGANPPPPVAAPPPYRSGPALGRHEVIIETPRHHCDLVDLDPVAMTAVIETYRHRHERLASFPDAASVLLFRNRGAGAGASLAHPHAQIAALPRLPDVVRRRQHLASDHYRRNRRCLLQEVATAEIADGRRILHHDARMIAFVPFAAEVPGEIWILPVAPRAAFRQIEAAEALALGRALQACLIALRLAFGDPDYNLVICDPPVEDYADPSQCWHLRIHPRLSRYGGYEIGTGDRINPSLPEADAATLRAALARNEPAADA